MHLLRLALLLCSLLALAESKKDFICAKGKLSRKKVTLKDGQSYFFKTNIAGKYKRRTNCQATYKRARGQSCQLSFSCTKFVVAAKNSKCTRGSDFMLINGKKYCKKTGPDVTVSGSQLKVVFRAMGRSRGAQGAHCTIKCSASQPATTTAPAPIGDCLCGLAQRNTRIVGGTQTEVNEYPWQVGMVWKDDTFVWCGGSLISDSWVLTASHCVDGKQASSLQVLLGEHNLVISSESTTVRRNIAQIVMHAKYDDYTTNYDFALMKLSKPVDFTQNSHIRPICLPRSADKDKTYEGYVSTITGWGTINFGGASPNELQEVNVKVISDSSCANDYSYQSWEIKDQMMCAAAEDGQGGKDSCQGDSGGPLITKEPASDGVTAGENYELIGVVSWGNGCALANSPGVYARVTKQLSWITKKAGTLNTCPRA